MVRPARSAGPAEHGVQVAPRGAGLASAVPCCVALSPGGTLPALTPSAGAAARPGGRSPARRRPRGGCGRPRLLPCTAAAAAPSPAEPSRRRPCPRCPMASPAAAGPGAALPAGAGTARRDFYWLRSFIAGGGSRSSVRGVLPSRGCEERGGEPSFEGKGFAQRCGFSGWRPLCAARSELRQ